MQASGRRSPYATSKALYTHIAHTYALHQCVSMVDPDFQLKRNMYFGSATEAEAKVIESWNSQDCHGIPAIRSVRSSLAIQSVPHVLIVGDSGVEEVLLMQIQG